MNTPILLANRTTRAGAGDLGLLLLDIETARSEADLARGLLLGMCRRNSLVPHVARATRNADADVTVVSATYRLGEEIAEELGDLGVASWWAQRDNQAGPGLAEAQVQIAVPEKLLAVAERIRLGAHRPELLFVVDPEGYLDRRWRRQGFEAFRGQHVGRFKAACHAAAVRPFVAVWTAQALVSFSFDILRRLYGVEAWLCMDGRTLRTAAVAAMEREGYYARCARADKSLYVPAEAVAG